MKIAQKAKCTTGGGRYLPLLVNMTNSPVEIIR